MRPQWVVVSKEKIRNGKEKIRRVNFCLPQPQSSAPHDNKSPSARHRRGTPMQSKSASRQGPENRIGKEWNVDIAARAFPVIE
jgi:hypothetical protein